MKEESKKKEQEWLEVIKTHEEARQEWSREKQNMIRDRQNNYVESVVYEALVKQQALDQTHQT